MRDDVVEFPELRTDVENVHPFESNVPQPERSNHCKP